MANLNLGLTLNQIQLLAYSIYCTQQDGSTKFIKADFERMFDLKKYKTEDAYEDSEKISSLRYSTQDLEEKKFSFTAIFTELQYDNGQFRIEWNPKFVPHILELKDHYVTTDLQITSQFKSSFSWTLYEYLKARYGAYYIPVSKEALLRLFGVEDRKTYISSTAQFKRGVLDPAVAEINKFTELEVWYKEKKKGRAIIGFEIHWSTGKTIPLATQKQTEELARVIDSIFDLSSSVLQMNNIENMKRASNLVRESEAMRKSKDEKMTSKEANEFIPQAKYNLRTIEAIIEYDKRPIGAKKVEFYNWLEERG